MLTISLKGIDNAGRNFSGEVLPEALNLDSTSLKGDVSFVKPIQYSFHVSEVSAGILVAGTMSAIVEVTCGRCLEPFDFELTLNDVCHFLENATTDIIDVTEDLREDLLISLPVKFICDDECAGLCCECGTNLNLESCSCDGSSSTELDPETSPWDILDQVKI
jgi:uncharacterized protein